MASQDNIAQHVAKMESIVVSFAQLTIHDIKGVLIHTAAIQGEKAKIEKKRLRKEFLRINNVHVRFTEADEVTIYQIMDEIDEKEKHTERSTKDFKSAEKINLKYWFEEEEDCYEIIREEKRKIRKRQRKIKALLNRPMSRKSQLKIDDLVSKNIESEKDIAEESQELVRAQKKIGRMKMLRYHLHTPSELRGCCKYPRRRIDHDGEASEEPINAWPVCLPTTLDFPFQNYSLLPIKLEKRLAPLKKIPSIVALSAPEAIKNQPCTLTTTRQISTTILDSSGTTVAKKKGKKPSNGYARNTKGQETFLLLHRT